MAELYNHCCSAETLHSFSRNLSELCWVFTRMSGSKDPGGDRICSPWVNKEGGDIRNVWGVWTHGVGVHVQWDMCPTMWRHLSTGKTRLRSIRWHCTVVGERTTNPGKRRFISVGEAHLGSVNDKTACWYDDFLEWKGYEPTKLPYVQVCRVQVIPWGRYHHRRDWVVVECRWRVYPYLSFWWRIPPVPAWIIIWTSETT